MRPNNLLTKRILRHKINKTGIYKKGEEGVLEIRAS